MNYTADWSDMTPGEQEDPNWANLPGNHVVLIVGYQDDPEVESGGYVICKNSWKGEDFGDNGFGYIRHEVAAFRENTWALKGSAHRPDSSNIPGGNQEYPISRYAQQVILKVEDERSG
jgi:hypothetical protein